VLEVCYNGMAEPAVRVPMADFFCDGCGGQARTFSSPCVEKAPHAYNCFIPMPFEGQCRIVLRNETPVDLLNYAFVEWERLPQWDPSLGYFHAAWRRWAFQLSGDTDEPFFHVDGRGHLIGRHWSITTDDPLFQGCHFVMEGNNEVRIDGDAEPRADYLGSEDSFTFSWGWPELFEGRWAGINHVREKAPTELSTYRFLGHNAIPFNTSLDWRVDWTHEFPGNPFHDLLARRMADGGAWVDYATTHYWYQERPGYPHAPLPPLADRIRPVLHANPPYEPQLP
jgi:hypothetical protein